MKNYLFILMEFAIALIILYVYTGIDSLKIGKLTSRTTVTHLEILVCSTAWVAEHPVGSPQPTAWLILTSGSYFVQRRTGTTVSVTRKTMWADRRASSTAVVCADNFEDLTTWTLEMASGMFTVDCCAEGVDCNTF